MRPSLSTISKLVQSKYGRGRNIGARHAQETGDPMGATAGVSHLRLRGSPSAFQLSCRCCGVPSRDRAPPDARQWEDTAPVGPPADCWRDRGVRVQAGKIGFPQGLTYYRRNDAALEGA